jgi:hypothetical protein
VGGAISNSAIMRKSTLDIANIFIDCGGKM